MQPLFDTVFALIAIGTSYLSTERHRLRPDAGSLVNGGALGLAGLLALGAAVGRPAYGGTASLSDWLLGMTYLVGFAGLALSTHVYGRALHLGGRGLALTGLSLAAVAVLVVGGLSRIAAPPAGVLFAVVAAAGVYAIGACVRHLHEDAHGRLLAALIWGVGVLAVFFGGLQGTAVPEMARALGAAVLFVSLIREHVRMSREADVRVGRFERYQEAGQTLGDSRHPSTVVETIAARALDVSGAAAALVFRVDADAHVVRAVSWAGDVSAELARSLELPIGQGAAGVSVAQNRGVWARDVREATELAFPPDVAARMAAAGLRAVVAVPMTFRSGTTFGALSLIYREPRALEDGELALLSRFAAQGALALEHARTFDQLAARATRDAGLHELSQRLLEASAEEIIRSACVRFTKTLLDADFVALFVANAEGTQLRLEAGLGWGPGIVGEISVATSDESFAGYAFVHKTALQMDDLREESRFAIPSYMQSHGVRSGLVVPLGVRQQPVGALAAYYRMPRHLADEESRVLTTIAEETALALERTRLSAQQRESLERLQDTQAQVMQADKLQALGTLLSGLAHELNNPLSTIQLSVQLMKRQQGLPDNVRRRMDAMEDECDRASRIIRDLLVFARRKPPEKRPVDINDILRSTLTAQAPDFADKIRVETELGDIPPVMADAHQIQQVLLNLFTNARHAMQGARGFGTLTVRTATRGGQTLIEVEDDGPGIPPENLGRIFDPFFTTKSTGEGSGLGLSLSIGIVQAHGGTIQVANVPAGGACFIVRLPADGTSGEVKAPSANASAAKPNGRRRAHVLVVDDEVQLRATLTDVFEALGHEVESVGSGAEALTRLANGGFDFVSLDMRLPDIDGKGIWQELVSRNPALASRVVFMTGDTMSPEALQFLQETGRPVLTKPLSIDRVGRIVEEVLAANPPAAATH